MPIKVYDETIGVLKRAVDHAGLVLEEALGAIQRLDEQAWGLEGRVEGGSWRESERPPISTAVGASLVGKLRRSPILA